MVTHLEAHPDMHAVVNFAPVLLEQLDDYAAQLKAWLDHGTAMMDPMLNLLAGVTPIPQSSHERFQLLCDCQRANAEKMIDPYPAFKHLLELVSQMFPGGACDEHDTACLQYLNSQYYIDVLVWYHIAWLGHTLKQTQTSETLTKKASMYDEADRRALLQLIYDCISQLIPRYRKLAEREQIELSMTPYGHPIIPLLNNMENMKCSQPNAPMPENGNYPGGVDRSRWHIQQGIDCFKKYFGRRPKGIWLSEGAISEDAVALVEEFGFKWTASGEGVWRNSMHLSKYDPEKVHSKRALFHPYVLNNYTKTKLFFRDGGLSDKIGFVYSKMNSVDAADDLVQNLVNIADFLGKGADKHVVSVILDGENAWEYYPHNGYYFLDHLYKTLSNHKLVRATTFSRLKNIKKHELKKLCAGSWVYGSFSTWIGEPDKNRAWDRLVEAKRAYDDAIAAGALSKQERELATRQLAVCEGSDWFWWFGEKNSSESVEDFDRLFRIQLRNLYKLLKLEVPENLDIALSKGGGKAENAGTMIRDTG